MSRPLKIRALNVDVNASLPEGAVLVGHTKVGNLPIYRVRKLVTKNQARVNKETNEIEFAKHPTTGEPLYQKRELIPMGDDGTWYVDGFVVPNQQGNGNLSWDDYTPPTPEEIAAAEREKKMAELIPALAGALLDNDVTPESLVAALKGAPAPAPAATTPVTPIVPPGDIPPPPRETTGDAEPKTDPPAGGPPADGPPPPDPEFPKALPGVGRWELSNGNVLTGVKKTDAIEAEAALKPPEH